MRLQTLNEWIGWIRPAWELEAEVMSLGLDAYTFVARLATNTAPDTAREGRIFIAMVTTYSGRYDILRCVYIFCITILASYSYPRVNRALFCR
jgi:hypothetical protein